MARRERIGVADAMELVGFGDRLRAALRRRGMSMHELARRSGMACAAVSYYCNGLRDPGLSRLVRLRRALGCTWEELMGE